MFLFKYLFTLLLFFLFTIKLDLIFAKGLQDQIPNAKALISDETNEEKNLLSENNDDNTKNNESLETTENIQSNSLNLDEKSSQDFENMFLIKLRSLKENDLTIKSEDISNTSISISNNNRAELINFIFEEKGSEDVNKAYAALKEKKLKVDIFKSLIREKLLDENQGFFKKLKTNWLGEVKREVIPNNNQKIDRFSKKINQLTSKKSHIKDDKTFKAFLKTELLKVSIEIPKTWEQGKDLQILLIYKENTNQEQGNPKDNLVQNNPIQGDPVQGDPVQAIKQIADINIEELSKLKWGKDNPSLKGEEKLTIQTLTKDELNISDQIYTNIKALGLLPAKITYQIHEYDTATNEEKAIYDENLKKIQSILENLTLKIYQEKFDFTNHEDGTIGKAILNYLENEKNITVAENAANANNPLQNQIIYATKPENNTIYVLFARPNNLLTIALHDKPSGTLDTGYTWNNIKNIVQGDTGYANLENPFEKNSQDAPNAVYFFKTPLETISNDRFRSGIYSLAHFSKSSLFSSYIANTNGDPAFVAFFEYIDQYTPIPKDFSNLEILKIRDNNKLTTTGVTYIYFTHIFGDIQALTLTKEVKNEVKNANNNGGHGGQGTN